MIGRTKIGKVAAARYCAGNLARAIRDFTPAEIPASQGLEEREPWTKAGDRLEQAYQALLELEVSLAGDEIEQ